MLLVCRFLCNVSSIYKSIYCLHSSSLSKLTKNGLLGWIRSLCCSWFTTINSFSRPCKTIQNNSQKENTQSRLWWILSVVQFFFIFLLLIVKEVLLFRFRLSPKVRTTPGTVLHLSVWDKDMKFDDFIGECFVPLSTMESLKHRAGLRDIPVTELPLRVPVKNMQPPEFEVNYCFID